MSIRHAVRSDVEERRDEYNRHLGVALGISVVVHLALIGLYLVTAPTDVVRPPAIFNDTTRTTVMMGAAQPELPRSSEPSHDAPSRHKAAGQSQASAPLRGGAPVTADDSLVVDGSFASGKDIAYATPRGSDITGKGNDSGGLGRPLPVENHPRGGGTAQSRPKPDDFVAAEEQPVWDAADLRRRVTYPEIARRNSIEGVVVVRALVDLDGRVVDTQIDRSDNAILTDAAVQAVRATPFTAAKQNGYPIAIWIQIPVTFTLN